MATDVGVVFCFNLLLRILSNVCFREFDTGVKYSLVAESIDKLKKKTVRNETLFGCSNRSAFRSFWPCLLFSSLRPKSIARIDVVFAFAVDV